MKLQISPYNTRQEEYREDPWKMLMVCFMLNQTSHKQVDKVRHEFFDKYSDAQSLLNAKDEDIVSIIKPLGFYNRRAKTWKKFCQEWINATETHGTNVPLEVLENMSGVGKYALDSWVVFQLCDYSIEVDDHVLNWYVDWAREEVERIKREGKEATPYVVYYLHYKDNRDMDPNWMQCQDYAACVMARTEKEARDKVEEIAMRQDGAVKIKVVGICKGEPDWVNEESPIFTDEKEYRKRATQVFNDITLNKTTSI